VSLVGKVAGPATGDGHDRALRFRLRDRSGTTTVPVVYRGSVPDLFKPGREVVVDGRLVDGTFVAVPGTLVTKCPSKYAPAKKKYST
jgi:cytochrome c-type biogenesis protein CcmE